MKKRILITGASGFIGRQSVCPLLAYGYEIHLVTRHAAGLQVLPRAVHERCQVHEVDLLDVRAADRLIHKIRPSHLAHFAWAADPATRFSSPENLQWTAATLHLATALAAAGGRRMVVAGSCAEYDWGFETLIEGQTPLKPATLYGAAKASANELLRFAAPQLALSLVWGRVFFCYGPGEPAGRLISDVVTGLLAGRPVDCTAGHQIRDYMHVADVGCAFADLVDSDFDGSVNIASGTGMRLRDLVGIAANLIGRADLVRFGAKPVPTGEPVRLVADVNHLNRAIGFRPRYEPETGMVDTVEWYRHHGA